MNTRIVIVGIVAIMLLGLESIAQHRSKQAFLIHDSLYTGSAKVSSHNDYPQMVTQSTWNVLASGWDTVSQSTFLYDLNGHVLEEERAAFSAGTYTPDFRATYAYSPEGWLTNTDEFDWNGLAWDSTYRSSLSYDIYGNRTYYWTFAWNNGWDTTFGFRSDLQYRNVSQVETKVDAAWQSSLVGWNLQDSTIYHFNLANEWDTVTYYFHSIIGWTPEQRVVDITWYDFSKELPLTGRKQNYGSTWEDFERYRVAYGINDSETWVTDVYNSPNWDSTRKEVYLNDYHEHQTAYEYYEWSGGWLLNSGELNGYTYDGNGQTTLRIREYYDGTIYVPERRFEYSNFFAGIASLQIPTLEVIAYPNPVTNQLNFKLNRTENGPVQIALYDLQGRLRTQTHMARAREEVQIPILEGLENGTYVYRIQMKQGQAVGKIVVQR